MEKLTIQQISPYIPYGLEGSFQDEEDGTQYYTAKLETDNVEWFLEETSGIHLYPISCLTKTIQHEGREFIPIVELAKISGLEPYKGKKRLEHNKYVKGHFVDCKQFQFHGVQQRFAFFEDYGFRATLDGYKPFNQYQLFQKLAEWHINFVGIPEGLYIDKSTI